jgi:hypothetical protein
VIEPQRQLSVLLLLQTRQSSKKGLIPSLTECHLLSWDHTSLMNRLCLSLSLRLHRSPSLHLNPSLNSSLSMSMSVRSLLLLCSIAPHRIEIEHTRLRWIRIHNGLRRRDMNRITSNSGNSG